MASLLKPGRKMRGKLTCSDRSAQWEEVTDGLFMRRNAAVAMRKLVREHNCTVWAGADAGYYGAPTLTVEGGRWHYVFRLFTPAQLEIAPHWKKPAAAPRF